MNNRRQFLGLLKWGGLAALPVVLLKSRSVQDQVADNPIVGYTYCHYEISDAPGLPLKHGQFMRAALPCRRLAVRKDGTACFWPVEEK